MERKGSIECHLYFMVILLSRDTPHTALFVVPILAYCVPNLLVISQTYNRYQFPISMRSQNGKSILFTIT